MKEGFFMSAGIAAFIMSIWMFISSLVPNTTVDYLENLYHTDNIEIVWESKADSAYINLGYLNDIDDLYPIEDTPEYRAKIDSIVLDLDNLQGCTEKTIRYKVEINDTIYEDVRTFYYKDGKVITDNTSFRDQILNKQAHIDYIRRNLSKKPAL